MKIRICKAKQYPANTFRLVRFAKTILVIEKTILSGMLIRLYARVDSRPRKAAKGEMFAS